MTTTSVDSVPPKEQPSKVADPQKIAPKPATVIEESKEENKEERKTEKTIL